MRELPWIHQHEIVEPHVFHGARNRSDVAGMRRADQYDSY
jgi:hypothetical protein